MQDLIRKVALITGSTSGIGQSAAEKLARFGVKSPLPAGTGTEGNKLYKQLSKVAERRSSF